MIKPLSVAVSRLGRPQRRLLWLYFDTRLLVELTPELARDLTYQLADYVNLAVFPAERRSARIRRRLRSFIRRTPPTAGRRSTHARR
ncbi:hypothetical protein ACH4UT_34375 [Streptomyces sp. NPDC020799]|uniref:hypothetical protein n=1 Tax=Streptomyces sp. NPDC020799 TaxID=3365091 RepID=UPI0037975F5E